MPSIELKHRLAQNLGTKAQVHGFYFSNCLAYTKPRKRCLSFLLSVAKSSLVRCSQVPSQQHCLDLSHTSVPLKHKQCGRARYVGLLIAQQKKSRKFLYFHTHRLHFADVSIVLALTEEDKCKFSCLSTEKRY